MSGQLVLLHSFDGLSIQFYCSDVEDVVCVCRRRRPGLEGRRRAGGAWLFTVGKEEASARVLPM